MIGIIQDTWLIVPLGLAMTLLGGWQVWAFRQGRMRRMVSAYRDATSPWYIRNAGFVLFPGTLAMALWTATGLLAPVDSPVTSLAALFAFCASGIAVIAAAVWGRKPPQFLKPRWLLEEEARLGPPPPTTGFMRVVGRVSFAIAIGCGALIAAGPIVLILLQSGAGV